MTLITKIVVPEVTKNKTKKRKKTNNKQRDNSETLEVSMRKSEAVLAGFTDQRSHDMDVSEEINFDFYVESDVPLPRRLRQHVAFGEFLEDASKEPETFTITTMKRTRTSKVSSVITAVIMEMQFLRN